MSQESRNPPLRNTDDIELVNTNFPTENRREAAAEIDRLYHEEGIRAFTDMEEVGNWSRSLYQEVYQDHFRAIQEDDSNSEAADVVAAINGSDDGLGTYERGFRDGFTAGVEWAREHPELL